MRKLHTRSPLRAALQRGFSLMELMVALAIGLVIILAMLTIMISINRNNTELARNNSVIENGRFTMQLLESDLSHAGFWGGWVPRFDDLALTSAPDDVPAAIPDPCLTYNATNWNQAYIHSLLAIPVQVYEVSSTGTAPTVGTCALFANMQPNTHVVVVRHLAPCVASATATDEDCTKVSGDLYFQLNRCTLGPATYDFPVTPTAITVSATATAPTVLTVPSTHKFSAGMTVYASSLGGADAATLEGILARVTATTSTTVSLDFNTLGKTITVGSTTRLQPSYAFTTASSASLGNFVLMKRDCTFATTDPNTPAVGIADYHKFVSHVYWVRNYATTAGDGTPTLMRSTFRQVSGVLKHDSSDALVEGVEGFRVDLGIDNVSRSGATLTSANFSTAIAWADVSNQNSPTNRGDGSADTYVQCTQGTPCTALQLMNAVAMRVNVLVRAPSKTAGYSDGKTYTMGSGTNFITLGPFSDAYKRHLYTQAIRLTNISMRRELSPT